MIFGWDKLYKWLVEIFEKRKYITQTLVAPFAAAFSLYLSLSSLLRYPLCSNSENLDIAFNTGSSLFFS
jgi:hypothetical protein